MVLWDLWEVLALERVSYLLSDLFPNSTCSFLYRRADFFTNLHPTINYGCISSVHSTSITHLPCRVIHPSALSKSSLRKLVVGAYRRFSFNGAVLPPTSMKKWEMKMPGARPVDWRRVDESVGNFPRGKKLSTSISLCLWVAQPQYPSPTQSLRRGQIQTPIAQWRTLHSSAHSVLGVPSACSFLVGRISSYAGL